MDIDIGELLPIMRAKACEAFCSVLQIDLVAVEPWNIVNRVENPCDFGATVGFANDSWQGACTLGVSIADAAILLPELDEDLLFDALGEVGNTVCGLLSADPQFTSFYGILEQTPPLFSRGGAWLARSTGIQGKLAIGEASVIFGCTVRTSGPRRIMAGTPAA
ncbi:MAG: hypothetical protein AAB214_15715 [Fibrobacterota bacterium]